jgi:histidine ammonia-lyase
MKQANHAITIDGNQLTLEGFIHVVRKHALVNLDSISIERINQSREIVKTIVKENKTVYGINTGFGQLSQVVINCEQLSTLQVNLLKSHACGVGNHFNEEITRGMMLLRINALAKGYSGIRLETVNQLMLYLNENILPLIPEQGSLGASGDLAPLSHMALPLLGLGEVLYQGEKMATSLALEKAGIKALDRLEAKEGLSLINGTQAMTSVGAITLYDAMKLSQTLDIAGSMSMEALLGVIDAMDDRVHQVRGQVGQINCADNIRKITKGSGYLTRQGEIRVQDAYSLRCLPQVHGAIKDALEYIKTKVEIEMNAATDNPLVFDRDSVISGGNFHGEPMAISFDFLKIAIAEMASISERRIERLVNPHLSEGLPAFLTKAGGLNSGMMILQYSAASLVSENKVLSHPASVDSIPSSANQEDHVSMGTIAARGARDILNNTRNVVAIELMCAAQALDFREKKDAGEGTKEAYDILRKQVSFIESDEIMYPAMARINQMIKDEVILKAVEAVVGPLT